MDSKYELLNQWRSLNVNERILNAFDSIPREKFVFGELKKLAYHDHPLPTIREQSISQPTTIVAMMEALELKEGENVFEVGAGVGYQAALLSKVVGPTGRVVSADIIPELVAIARKNVEVLELPNVTIIESDGGIGHEEAAPFDKIIITAACPTIPQPLIDQLKEGGIIIAPVGDLESQTMIRGVKNNGKLELEFIGPFRFVPMRGKYGFRIK